MNDKKEIKKICIYGVGGVGGYFGGLLANRISEQHDKEREIYFVEGERTCGRSKNMG